MRALLLSILLALMGVAPALAADYPDGGVTGTEVAADLRAIEQMATLSEDSTGDPMIEASFKVGDSVIGYRIFFFNCTDGRCTSIQYHVAFDGHPDKVAEWNAGHRFARAYAHDDVIHLEYDLDVEEGANSAAIQNSARRFIAVLIDGVTFLG